MQDLKNKIKQIWFRYALLCGCPWSWGKKYQRKPFLCLESLKYLKYGHCKISSYSFFLGSSMSHILQFIIEFPLSNSVTVRRQCVNQCRYCSIHKSCGSNFHVCSLKRNILIRNTQFDSNRVLISNMRNVMEAQFDSHTRASGHSYTKYNNWETVWVPLILILFWEFGAWINNFTLIQGQFHLVDRGLDSRSCQ